MSTEYKLSYTGREIDEKLGKITDDTLLPEASTADDGQVLTVKDGKWIVGNSSGLTSEQFQALDNLFKIAVYKEDASRVYDAFRTAFSGIYISLDQYALKFTQTIIPQTLVATVSEDIDVVWSTTDSDVATVENGKVTPVSSGTCQIIARAGMASAYCNITVSIDETQPVSIKELTADDLLPCQLAGYYNTDWYADGGYCQKPSSGEGTRLSYFFFDIPITGGYAYKFPFEQPYGATPAIVGIEVVNSLAMESIMQKERFTSSNMYDPGWITTNGQEVIPPSTYNGYPLKYGRITFRAQSSGTSQLPVGSISRLVVYRRKVT